MGKVDELSRLGIRVWLVGDKVRVFPKQLVTDSVREMILGALPTLVKELTESEAALPLPYFDKNGRFVLPFRSPKRYHYWAGGQPLKKTVREAHVNNANACHDNETS